MNVQQHNSRTCIIIFLYTVCEPLLAYTQGNADGLKELYSRAQGEVSIREALRELELWGAGANFSLTSYLDSAEKELSIIKDWKELVNQVSAWMTLYMHVHACE